MDLRKFLLPTPTSAIPDQEGMELLVSFSRSSGASGKDEVEQSRKRKEAEADDTSQEDEKYMRESEPTLDTPMRYPLTDGEEERGLKHQKLISREGEECDPSSVFQVSKTVRHEQYVASKTPNIVRVNLAYRTRVVLGQSQQGGHPRGD